MAPELFIKGGFQSSAVDYRAADIWAVGAMAFFVLTKSRNYLSRRLIVFDEQAKLDFLPTDVEISEDAKSFLVDSTERDPEKRLGWKTASSHVWVQRSVPAIPIMVDQEAEYAEWHTSLFYVYLILI